MAEDQKTSTTDSTETAPASKVASEAVIEAVSESINSDPADLDASKNETLEKAEKEGDGGGEASSEELVLYSLPVKGPGGEELELQVNPGDTVMDLRQFLADTAETCFYTCYDLILTKPDGVRYHLIDFVEIGEVADVAAGGCTLEMYSGFYDERAVRFHVRKLRELVSMSSSNPSASTTLAAKYDVAQVLVTEKDLGTEEGKLTEKPPGSKNNKGPLPAELEGMRLPRGAEGAAETEGEGGELEVKGSLKELTERGEEETAALPACLDSISLSTFNPVPGHRRLQGELLYLDLITAEGKFFCVTAHTRGFSVNRSGNSKRLDWRKVDPKAEATTLVGLLKIISPKFQSAFSAVLEAKANRHPFENMVAPIPPNPWLAPFPTPEHTRRVERAEEALSCPFGLEITGIQRDWNEELQSCRELPKASKQDRILRDRALYRVTCEFADAAMKGAKAVISRSVPPLNPPDPERFHMYVHNNIFFSFAADGDFALLQQKREKELKEKEEAEKAGKEGGEGEGEGKEGEKKEGEDAASAAKEERAKETRGKEEREKKEREKEGAASPSVPSENDQATYASANNDLKGTKALNLLDVGGLYTLAMAIVDYRGHRLIAQSIIPGILYGDKTAAMLYGSVDNGKTIKWNEKFHEKMVELGKFLYLQEHTVKDSEGNGVKICAPVECKGIGGSDDRHYLLDVMRLTPKDLNYKGESNQLCVLRPELVMEFVKEQMVQKYMAKKGLTERPDEQTIQKLWNSLRDTSKIKFGFNVPKGDTEIKGEAGVEKSGNSVAAAAKGEAGAEPKEQKKEAEEEEDVEDLRTLFNANICSDFQVVGEDEMKSTHEALVKSASAYLVDKALPRMVERMKSLEASAMDGETMTELFHAHGVNLRYLGQVASQLDDFSTKKGLCLVEMICRATKHVLKAVLRETLDHDVAGAIAHFLNCFLGTFSDPSVPPNTLPEEKTKEKEKEKGTASSAASKGGKKGKEGDKEGEKEGGKGVSKKKIIKAKTKAESKEGEGPASASDVSGGSAGEEAKEEGKGEEKKEGLEQLPNPLLDTSKPGFTRITADMVWSDISEGVKFKYQYELPKDVRGLVKNVSSLRNICLKMGIVLAARDFAFTSPTPLRVDDVTDLVTRVKFFSPECKDATELLEKGKSIVKQVGLPLEPKFCGVPFLGQWLRENEGKLNESFEVLSEAYQILQQVCGPLHPDVASCCRYLSLIFYHAGETGSAILQQHRELIVSERVYGVDHPNTIYCYGNLALFWHSMGEVGLALELMVRTLKLLQWTGSMKHIAVTAALINTAMMSQDYGHAQSALRFLEASLSISEKSVGASHVHTSSCQHALALSYASMGSFKLALQQERKALSILESRFGKEDPRTKESEHWVQSFLDREIRKQRVGQQSSSQSAATAIKFAEAIRQRPDLLQALQQAAAANPNNSHLMTPSLQSMLNPSLLSQSTASAGRAAATNPGATANIRGRGMDERGARAAAEARRKAVARGVNLRSGPARGKAGAAGGSSSATAPLDVDDILNFINNSGAAQGAATAAGSKLATAGSSSKSAAGSTAGAGLGSGVHGLGSGLGVGLGAVAGVPPPTATNGPSAAAKVAGKKTSGAALSSSSGSASTSSVGTASATPSGPIGLGGLSLNGPAKKGKGKGK